MENLASLVLTRDMLISLKKYTNNNESIEALVNPSDYGISSDHFDQNLCSSSSLSAYYSPYKKLSNKFVANVYDRRVTRLFECSTLKSSNINKQSIKTVPSSASSKPATCHIKNRVSQLKDSNNNNDKVQIKQTCKHDDESHLKMKLFLTMKDARDAVCVKMTQASNLLRLLNRKARDCGYERLVAEKLLLETETKYKLLVEKIRNDDYYPELHENPDKLGTLTISGVTFPRCSAPTTRSDHKTTEHFVLLLTCGTEIKSSKILSIDDLDASINSLKFDDTFDFDLTHNFQIKLQVYSLTMSTNNNRDNNLSRLLIRYWSNQRQLRGSLPATTKIYYKNTNTGEMVASDVVKTSFVLRGESTIRRSDLDHTGAVLKPLDFWMKLAGTVSLSATATKLMISTERAGFLTFGRPRRATIVWDRRWCSLRGLKLRIYNSPADEGLYDAIETIDLTQCLGDGVEMADRSVCSRTRTISIETVRDDGITTDETLGFDFRQYYFRADNADDLAKWFADLNFVREVYNNWNCNGTWL